ncbi:MAG: hypothetical protein KF778_22355 [Rhodocyclaceae bacterium]|nr:hypothetical protein [Rhodocyclaceae bacterium]MBX3671149.1 hypothetical protein [Rhodocyclaceae bacterium]
MLRRRRRPFRITLPILVLIALDVTGLTLCSAALMFLVHGVRFLKGHPASTVEAVIMLVAGTAIMLGAAMGLLRNFAAQGNEPDQRDEGRPPA